MDIIAETLRWVNDVRAQYNIGPALDRLPKGYPRALCRCPIALALGSSGGPGSGDEVEVAPEGVYIARLGEHLTPPPSVARFIEMVDSHELPEYEL